MPGRATDAGGTRDGMTTDHDNAHDPAEPPVDDDLLDFFSPRSGPRPLGRILREMGVVKESHVQEALAIQRDQGGLLGEILVALGCATTLEVAHALARQLGMEVIDLDARRIRPEVLATLEARTARTHRVVPVEQTGETLTIAMADPLNYRTLDDLRFLLDRDVRGAAADPEQVDRALERYYPRRSAPGSS
jgi:type IV pilus assembly protein PilB